MLAEGSSGSVHPATVSEPRSADKNQGVDDDSRLFAQYCKQLNGYPVMKAESEFEIAREIAALEVTFWRHAFSNRRKAPVVATAVLGALRKQLSKSGKSGGDDEEDVQRRKKFERNVASVDRSLQLMECGRKYPDTDRGLNRLAAILQAIDLDKALARAAFRVISTDKYRGNLSRWAQETSTTQREITKKRTDFYNGNLRLVISVARRLNRYQMPLIDFIQFGNIGLIKAVHRFDPERGFRFSTFATWWIRHALERANHDHGSQIRVPVHAHEVRMHARRVEKKLRQKLERDPTEKEISNALGKKMATRYRHVESILAPMTSLDQPVGSAQSEDRLTPFKDLLADERDENNAFHLVKSCEDVQVLLKALERIPPRLARVLKMRFGIDQQDKEPRTLQDIGQEMQLSRERVRQIEREAIRALRIALAGCEEPSRPEDQLPPEDPHTIAQVVTASSGRLRVVRKRNTPPPRYDDICVARCEKCQSRFELTYRALKLMQGRHVCDQKRLTRKERRPRMR